MNMSKMRGSCSAAMPMPVSRTRITAPASPSRSTVDARLRPPCVGELAGVAQAGCPPPGSAGPGRRRGTSGCGGTTTVSSMLCCLAEAAGRPRRHRCTTDASSTRSLRSSILPRLMRLTSSRSSTSRTIWPTCRSIIVATRESGRPRPALAARVRMICSALRMGASGLRSSCAEHRQELVLAAVGLGEVGGDWRSAVLCASLGDVARDLRCADDASAPSRTGETDQRDVEQASDPCVAHGLRSARSPRRAGSARGSAAPHRAVLGDRAASPALPIGLSRRRTRRGPPPPCSSS